MDLNLAEKVFLITGGTDGLGLALAEGLVEEGAAVAVCGRDEERMRSALAKLEDGGGDGAWLACRTTRAEEVEGRRPTLRWRGGDASTAGSQRAAGRLESVGDEEWDADLQLKLMGAVRLTRKALPQLRASRGAVLFTLAMAAKAPGGGSAPSSVSRAAGMALMKALSKELGTDGVRVNAVLVGLRESGQGAARRVRRPGPGGVLPAIGRARRHPTRAFRSEPGILGPGLLPALGALLLRHRLCCQPRRRPVAGGLIRRRVTRRIHRPPERHPGPLEPGRWRIRRPSPGASARRRAGGHRRPTSPWPPAGPRRRPRPPRTPPRGLRPCVRSRDRRRGRRRRDAPGAA